MCLFDNHDASHAHWAPPEQMANPAIKGYPAHSTVLSRVTLLTLQCYVCVRQCQLIAHDSNPLLQLCCNQLGALTLWLLGPSGLRTMAPRQADFRWDVSIS
jgi:hypothetical protein